MVDIIIDSRLTLHTRETVKFENINLTESVINLKKKVAQKFNTSHEKLYLIYHGVLLKNSMSIKDAGISSGSIVHCLPKYENSIPVAAPFSLIEVQQLLVSLRSTVSNPNFLNIIQKLKTPDMVEQILTACPFANKDPTALAFVQDADLFISLTKPDELNRIIEGRPSIGRLAQYVSTIIAKEVTSPKRSHFVSYSLDALSDEEDMDIEQSGDSISVSRASRASTSASTHPITPAQLAAALANATGRSSLGLSSFANSSPLAISTPPSGAATSTVTPYNTPAPPSAGGSSQSPGPITTEMFNQALQNALVVSANSNTLCPPTSVNSLQSNSSSFLNLGGGSTQFQNIEESLQLMREMGIGDEDLGRQALQATNGDVQAAVDLIFSQWMFDD